MLRDFSAKIIVSHENDVPRLEALQYLIKTTTFAVSGEVEMPDDFEEFKTICLRKSFVDKPY